MLAYLNDPLDTTAAERIARSLCVSFDMIAAFATWIVDIETIKRCLVPGSVSQSEKIGAALRASEKGGNDPVREMEKITGGREIFRGEIKGIDVKTQEGFDFGRTTVEGIDGYKNSTIAIDFKNENMILWKDEKPLVMVPDIIATMEIGGKPLTNADTEEGMKITVMAIPAPEPWKRGKEGFDCWRHILERLGYKGS